MSYDVQTRVRLIVNFAFSVLQKNKVYSLLRYITAFGNVSFSSGWDIGGFGDFNGDGRTDVFWRNYNTGDTSAWLMNGESPPTYILSLGDASFSSGWLIGGFGDFNGDGRTDVFWRNFKTGDTSAWLMNGESPPIYTPSLGSVSLSPGWLIDGLGDFNGDGKTDVFWRNYKTGDAFAWLINGANLPNYTGYGNVPPSSGWEILSANQRTGKVSDLINSRPRPA